MGAIPSKKLHCDLECFAPIQGRYTPIHEERTTSCNAVGTQNVKVLSKSCENSSALHKLTKLDASESSTKDSSREFRQPQRGHRNLTLHMIIRRRPSYRKALREPNCISNFVQKGTPEDYKSAQREKAMDTRVNCTANERENICENVNMQIEHFEKKVKLTLKSFRRYSLRLRPYENSKLPTSEMQTRQNKVSEGSIEQLAKNSDQEIDTEKLMRDLRTAYELKKNLRKQEMESFYTKEKSTFKIKAHPRKRRIPYEKVKPKAATEINNQIEPCKQQEMKSVLLMEIENKLHKLRKTGRKEILDNDRPRNNKPYFVTCLPPAQTLIKEQLLAELKQYFDTNYKN